MAVYFGFGLSLLTRNLILHRVASIALIGLSGFVLGRLVLHPTTRPPLLRGVYLSVALHCALITLGRMC